MLFPPEHVQAVKAWIVKRLENISDADADVLADYVIALLDHEGDVATVRKLCEAEIPDFLKEDSADFIDDVFRAIQYQAYLPGAPPLPPRQPPPPLQPPPIPVPYTGFGLSYDDAPSTTQPTLPAPQQPQTNLGGSRKRSYYDRDGADQHPQDSNSQRGGGGRRHKQARRHGARGRDWDAPNDTAGFVQRPPPYGLGFPSNGAQWQPPFDMSQAMNMFGGMTAPGSSSPQGPPQGRHQAFPMLRQGAPGEGDFDPASTALAMNAFISNASQVPGLPPFQWGMKGGMQKQRNQPKKARKAEISADGPVFDRKKSTLVVENIPPESLGEDAVREFFSQFGKIVQVTVKPAKRLALVKYDNWAAANAAFVSPKVVFDNRFVKVFWHKGDESAKSGGKNKGKFNGVNSNGDSSHSAVNERGADADATQEPEIDMEEFHRRQEEAQKTQDEKKQKLQELELQQERLQKKQKELFLKRQEEIARLNAKLALSAKKSREDGAGGAKAGQEDLAANPKPSTQTELLRAQLAALEKEAIEMGIDPHADMDTESQFSTSSAGFRGRGRGRGRGSGGFFSSRGRGSRGAFRGGYVAGSNDTTYAPYSLDNRPRKVAVIGVDFSVPERDESLRAYLFGIGEFDDIQTNSSQTEISFKDRKTAEKFMYSIANQKIPGVDGQVDVAWIAANGSLIKSVPGTPRGLNGNGFLGSAPKQAQKEPASMGDDAENTTAAASGDDKDVSIVLDRPVDAIESGDHGEQGEQGYMDYDVADDNQWDIG